MKLKQHVSIMYNVYGIMHIEALHVVRLDECTSKRTNIQWLTYWGTLSPSLGEGSEGVSM